MTAIAWDEAGSRRYEVGVDRGVFFAPSVDGIAPGIGYPWNGLISVEDSTGREVKPYYLDGQKYLEVGLADDYAGKLTAFTYPDEFELCNGMHSFKSPDDGFDSCMYLHGQKPRRFGMSYRTRQGNDVDGVSGYKIHWLYNLLAVPDAVSHSSLGDTIDPMNFSWSLTGLANDLTMSSQGHKMTAHVSIDSRKIHPTLLANIEMYLYGNESLDPQLMVPGQLMTLVGSWYG